MLPIAQPAQNTAMRPASPITPVAPGLSVGQESSRRSARNDFQSILTKGRSRSVDSPRIATDPSTKIKRHTNVIRPRDEARWDTQRARRASVVPLAPKSESISKADNVANPVYIPCVGSRMRASFNLFSREACERESPKVGPVFVGDTVTVIDTDCTADNIVRLLVESDKSEVVGWVSLMSKQGSLLLSPDPEEV